MKFIISIVLAVAIAPCIQSQNLRNLMNNPQPYVSPEYKYTENVECQQEFCQNFTSTCQVPARLILNGPTTESDIAQ